MPKATLYHLTTNTGHVARTRRVDVADDIIDLLRPLIAAKKARIPGPVAWWLHMREAGPGWASFAITPSATGDRPYVTAVGCWYAQASTTAWAHILDRAGEPPTEVPWLAVTTLPALCQLPPPVLTLVSRLL